MNTSPIRDLAQQWRAEAGLYRRRGMEAQACMTETFASELEQAVEGWELEDLTLEQASGESGWSYSSRQQRVGRGELPNAGQKGSPRIKRCDLPMKGGRARPRVEEGGPDLADEILSSRLAG